MCRSLTDPQGTRRRQTHPRGHPTPACCRCPNNVVGIGPVVPLHPRLRLDGARRPVGSVPRKGPPARTRWARSEISTAIRPARDEAASHDQRHRKGQVCNLLQGLRRDRNPRMAPWPTGSTNAVQRMCKCQAFVVWWWDRLRARRRCPPLDSVRADCSPQGLVHMKMMRKKKKQEEKAAAAAKGA